MPPEIYSPEWVESEFQRLAPQVEEFIRRRYSNRGARWGGEKLDFSDRLGRLYFEISKEAAQRRFEIQERMRIEGVNRTEAIRKEKETASQKESDRQAEMQKEQLKKFDYENRKRFEAELKKREEEEKRKYESAESDKNIQIWDFYNRATSGEMSDEDIESARENPALSPFVEQRYGKKKKRGFMTTDEVQKLYPTMNYTPSTVRAKTSFSTPIGLSGFRTGSPSGFNEFNQNNQSAGTKNLSYGPDTIDNGQWRRDGHQWVNTQDGRIANADERIHIGRIQSENPDNWDRPTYGGNTGNVKSDYGRPAEGEREKDMNLGTSQDKWPNQQNDPRNLNKDKSRLPPLEVQDPADWYKHNDPNMPSGLEQIKNDFLGRESRPKNWNKMEQKPSDTSTITASTAFTNPNDPKNQKYQRGFRPYSARV